MNNNKDTKITWVIHHWKGEVIKYSLKEVNTWLLENGYHEIYPAQANRLKGNIVNYAKVRNRNRKAHLNGFDCNIFKLYSI